MAEVQQDAAEDPEQVVIDEQDEIALVFDPAFLDFGTADDPPPPGVSALALDSDLQAAKRRCLERGEAATAFLRPGQEVNIRLPTELNTSFLQCHHCKIFSKSSTAADDIVFFRNDTWARFVHFRDAPRGKIATASSASMALRVLAKPP